MSPFCSASTSSRVAKKVLPIRSITIGEVTLPVASPHHACSLRVDTAKTTLARTVVSPPSSSGGSARSATSTKVPSSWTRVMTTVRGGSTSGSARSSQKRAWRSFGASLVSPDSSTRRPSSMPVASSA